MRSHFRIAFLGVDHPHGAGWRDSLAQLGDEVAVVALMPGFGGALTSLEERHATVPRFDTVDDLIQWNQFDGAIVCLPFAGQLVSETADAPASSIWWLVYLGVFPTAIAFTTYAYALRHMTAGNLGVTTYLVPPITIVMGLVFLDEVPPTMAYLGGALALVGVAVARRKPRSASKEVAPAPEAAMLKR